MTLQIKTSFESANVLIIFILPTMERSLWNHIFNVFFKDPNQEWYLFCGAKGQAIAFQILFDLVLDQSTFRKAIINQIILMLIEHQKEVQLCHLHIAKFNLITFIYRNTFHFF